jgi:hypothetical protein
MRTAPFLIQSVHNVLREAKKRNSSGSSIDPHQEENVLRDLVKGNFRFFSKNYGRSS